ASNRKASTGKARQTLTEEEKRRNHIRSEQNRRDIMKDNFGRINHLVPALNGGKSGLSRAD
ncbi:hypothetical protein BAUCODRAFT_51616, partial [Baudoinia panamericana UAMH 10762]